MNLFFLVLARDEKFVDEKAKELQSLGVSYLIVCGKKINRSDAIFREPKGKYDAINFGSKFIPEDVDVVALNDVDTKLRNVWASLKYFDFKNVDLVFAKVSTEGPTKFFNVLLDLIRKKLIITANGELMLVRRNTLMTILPIKPCKAEDSYILYKVLEGKHKAVFCEKSVALTVRTKRVEMEEAYRRKTVCGIYQALGYTKPPFRIRAFYALLPFSSPLLLVFGRKGYFWTKGILLGVNDYLRGDRSGTWQTTYMENH